MNGEIEENLFWGKRMCLNKGMFLFFSKKAAADIL